MILSDFETGEIEPESVVWVQHWQSQPAYHQQVVGSSVHA